MKDHKAKIEIVWNHQNSFKNRKKKLYDKAEDHLKSVVIFHRYPRLRRKSLRIIIINCSFIVRYQKIRFKN